MSYVENLSEITSLDAIFTLTVVYGLAWFVWLLIGIAINILAYLLMPGAKQPKPPAAQDLEGPVADAEKPIPVIFGTVQIKGLNCLGYMEADTWSRKVKV